MERKGMAARRIGALMLAAACLAAGWTGSGARAEDGEEPLAGLTDEILDEETETDGFDDPYGSDDPYEAEESVEYDETDGEDMSDGTGGDPEKTAPELTESLAFSANARNKDFHLMRDRDFSTYFPMAEKKAEMTVTCPEPMSGIYIMAFDKYGRDHEYDLQIPEGDGWKTVDHGGTYLVHWHELPEEVTSVRILATGKERLRIAEIRAFGPGEPPPEIQRWETLEKCDIMLLHAHPDDEILWFAGLMPVYGGERGYRIQTVVLAPTGGMRKLELLSAVWHCGVRYYPEMLGFIDKNGKNPEKQYKLWRGKNRVIGRVVEVIRKHQPEVLITHGEKGEYGHGAHKTAADAAKTAIKLTGGAGKYPESVKLYGTWEVKKLYLHEYEKNPIVCDWDEPLAAFGGKTGYEVAAEAFAFHQSQIQRDWAFEVHGKHDNAHFGLYYTSVGKDTGIGDLMEHIE